MIYLINKLKNKILNIFIFRISTTVITMLTSILIARVLGPNKYGYIALINSIINFIILFTDLGISSSIAYYIKKYEDSPQIKKIYFTSALTIKTIITLITTILIYHFRYYISYLTNDVIVSELLIFGSLLYFVLSLFRFIQKVCESLGYLEVIGLYIPVCQNIEKITALVVVSFTISVNYYFVVSSIITLIAVVFYITLVFIRNSIKRLYVKKNYIADLIRYGFPLLFSAMSSYIYMQSDTFMIQYYLGVEKVSYYSVVMKFASLIQIPVALLTSIYIPRLVEMYYKKNMIKMNIYFKEIFKGIVLSYIFFSILTVIYSKEIIEILFGIEYLKGNIPLKLYSIFVLFYGISSFVSVFIDYLGEGKFRAQLVAISAVLNVILNIFMIPKYGIIGAAITTQITYTPYVLISVDRLFKILRIEYIKSIKWFFRVSINFSIFLILSLLLYGLEDSVYIHIFVGCITSFFLGLFIVKNKLINISLIKEMLNIQNLY